MHVGIKASLTVTVGLGAILAQGVLAGEQALASGPGISTDLFQVSSNSLTITRDLVPQLVFDKQYAQQAPIEELLDDYLDYLRARDLRLGPGQLVGGGFQGAVAVGVGSAHPGQAGDLVVVMQREDSRWRGAVPSPLGAEG